MLAAQCACSRHSVLADHYVRPVRLEFEASLFISLPGNGNGNERSGPVGRLVMKSIKCCHRKSREQCPTGATQRRW